MADQPTREETAEAIRDASRTMAASLNALANRIAHRSEELGAEPQADGDPRPIMWEGEPVDIDATVRDRDRFRAEARTVAAHEALRLRFRADSNGDFALALNTLRRLTESEDDRIALEAARQLAIHGNGHELPSGEPKAPSKRILHQYVPTPTGFCAVCRRTEAAHVGHA